MPKAIFLDVHGWVVGWLLLQSHSSRPKHNTSVKWSHMAFMMFIFPTLETHTHRKKTNPHKRTSSPGGGEKLWNCWDFFFPFDVCSGRASPASLEFSDWIQMGFIFFSACGCWGSRKVFVLNWASKWMDVSYIEFWGGWTLKMERFAKMYYISSDWFPIRGVIMESFMRGALIAFKSVFRDIFFI